MKRKWPIVFRVSPEKGHHYRVIICRNRDQMYAVWKRQIDQGVIPGDLRLGKLNFLGQVTWWSRFKWMKTRAQWTKHPNCGQILLCADHIGAGLISHEMTHAATFFLAWTVGVRSLMRHATNERLCLVQGRLVQQFWDKWWKLFPSGRPPEGRRR